MAQADVLQPKKTAAIESDSLGERDITQITAKDFLSALDREGLGASSLNLLPEKKKLELYNEPEWTSAIKVKDLVRALKTEKKKVELELPIDLGARVNPQWAATLAALAGAGGGSAGYPTDDQTKWWPPPIEMRKVSLDHRFDTVATQISHLTLAINEIKGKLDKLAGR